MTAVVALGVAVLALLLSGAGVWAIVVWRRSRRALEVLADSLYVDSRLEQITVQTLAAMRAAVRQSTDQWPR